MGSMMMGGNILPQKSRALGTVKPMSSTISSQLPSVSPIPFLSTEAKIANSNLLQLSALFFKSVSIGISKKQFRDLVSDHVDYIHAKDNVGDAEITLANEIMANDQLQAYDHILGSYTLSTDGIDIMKKIVSIVKNNIQHVKDRVPGFINIDSLFNNGLYNGADSVKNTYRYPLFTSENKCKFILQIREYSGKDFDFTSNIGAHYFQLESVDPIDHIICEWYLVTDYTEDHKEYSVLSAECIFSITSLADYKLESKINVMIDLKKSYVSCSAINQNPNLIDAYMNVLDCNNAINTVVHDSEQKDDLIKYLMLHAPKWAPSFMKSISKKFFMNVPETLLHQVKFQNHLRNLFSDNRIIESIKEDTSEIKLDNLQLRRTVHEFIENNLGLVLISKHDCLEVSSSHSFQSYCEDCSSVFHKEFKYFSFELSSVVSEELLEMDDYYKEFENVKPLIYGVNLPENPLFYVTSKYNFFNGLEQFPECHIVL